MPIPFRQHSIIKLTLFFFPLLSLRKKGLKPSVSFFSSQTKPFLSSAMAPSEQHAPSMSIPDWLESLPSAPEYYPTESEFADPIGYLLKISPNASRFGLCKIIPPLPSPSKKSTLSNLSRSFSSLHTPPPATTTSSKRKSKKNKKPKNKTPAPTFSTFHQQVGPTGSQKPISPSGESYTLQQFETKSRKFEIDYLRRVAGGESLSPLQMETLF